MAYDKWMTIKDGAALVGVHTQSVRDRIAAGNLEHDYRYGVMVVSRAGCEAWRAERRAKAEAVLK